MDLSLRCQPMHNGQKFWEPAKVCHLLFLFPFVSVVKYSQDNFSSLSSTSQSDLLVLTNWLGKIRKFSISVYYHTSWIFISQSHVLIGWIIITWYNLIERFPENLKQEIDNQKFENSLTNYISLLSWIRPLMTTIMGTFFLYQLFGWLAPLILKNDGPIFTAVIIIIIKCFLLTLHL